MLNEVAELEEGGTLGVMLGSHALDRGYRVTISTFNLLVFDPTWFARPDTDLSAKLAHQAEVKRDPKLRVATEAYRQFLSKGGRIVMQDLTAGLIRRYLKRGIPILTGLSATYLYQSMRERLDTLEEDDMHGEPTGHFVVLCGYDKEARSVRVGDPYCPNPIAASLLYDVAIDRALCAILLGIMTYDANLVIIEPSRRASHRS